MKLEVDCYAGQKGDERPLRVRLDDRAYFGDEVLDQWCGPAGAFYKVHAQPLCPGAANVSARRKLASRVSSIKARALTVDMCLSLLGASQSSV